MTSCKIKLNTTNNEDANDVSSFYLDVNLHTTSKTIKVIATLGSDLDSESKLCSDESQSGL